MDLSNLNADSFIVLFDRAQVEASANEQFTEVLDRLKFESSMQSKIARGLIERSFKGLELEVLPVQESVWIAAWAASISAASKTDFLDSLEKLFLTVLAMPIEPKMEAQARLTLIGFLMAIRNADRARFDSFKKNLQSRSSDMLSYVVKLVDEAGSGL
jgi:hypothetical protein